MTAMTAVDTRGRYARLNKVQGFSQDALSATRILVAGVGAVGNELVKNLVLSGVGRLDLIDFDTVELHNLTRSVLLRETDVGLPKAHAVAARAGDLGGNTLISAVNGDVRRHVGLQQLKHVDVCIGAVDNMEARLWLSQLCRLSGTLFLHAGIDHKSVSIERYPFHLNQVEVNDANCACYACQVSERMYQGIAERYSCGGLLRAALQQKIVPTTAVTASVAGGYLTWHALNRDADTAVQKAPAQRWFLNIDQGTSQVSRMPRDSNCLSCHDSNELRLPRKVLGGQAEISITTLLEQMSDQQGIQLSHAVITEMHCQQCQQRLTAFLGHASFQYTDALTRCPDCAQNSVLIDSRDVLDSETLAHIYAQQRTHANSAGSPSIQASYGWLLNAAGEKLKLLDFSATEVVHPNYHL